MICKIPFESISIESDGVHIIMNARINSIPCRILIDTGASRTVFDSNRIERFVEKLESVENQQLSTGLGTNNMQSHITTLENFELGDLHLKNYQCIIIDMMHINESFNSIGHQQIDGVLGGDILNTYKAEVDYRKREIRFRFPKNLLKKNIV